jgi:hypothetical protein
MRAVTLEAVKAGTVENNMERVNDERDVDSGVDEESESETSELSIEELEKLFADLN